MIGKLLKIQFKLESMWFYYVILAVPLCCIATPAIGMLYGCLLILFISKTARSVQNSGIQLYLSLPAPRRKVIASKLLFNVIWQMMYCASYATMVIIASIWQPQIIFDGNILNNNLTQLGILLFAMGMFNAIFNITSAELNTVKSLLCMSLMLAVPAALNELAVRLCGKYLNGYDPQYTLLRLGVFALGAVLFCLLSYLGYKRALKSFGRSATNRHLKKA